MNEDILKIKLNEPPPDFPASLGPPEALEFDTEYIPDMGRPAPSNDKVLVPELISMTKYLFDNYRLKMYSFLNSSLRTGRLSDVVGIRVITRRINREVCNFPYVSYWKIDRCNFYSDVEVELKLQTYAGDLPWQGHLVLWCSFQEDGLHCDIEDFTDTTNWEAEGYIRMSKYLVPYYTNKKVDELAESLWLKYGIPEALTKPRARVATDLAERMGLKILHLPVHNCSESSIIFFEHSKLPIREKTEFGDPEFIIVPADTIVVNTNRVKKDYSSFNIFHECIHYEEHYMFYRLQKMQSNDIRQVKTVIVMDSTAANPNPVYFMELQADRGGYALMMPASDTNHRIISLCETVTGYRHFGEMYEKVGKELAKVLGIPHFRIRARMIQLGHNRARGALNYSDRRLIQPFAFDADAWQEEQHTFVIDSKTTLKLQRENEDFRNVMASGKYIYADGHVVRSDSRFIRRSRNGSIVLSEWANAHVDKCCLRFVRQYIQENVGRYVFGRMYYDADYVKWTQFYLDDLVNQGQMDDFDAKDRYIRDFPTDFRAAVNQLLKQYGASQAKMAELMHMDDSTFSRALVDPKKYRNEDFLMIIALTLRLPDWLSDLLFRRAHYQLDESDQRQRVLKHLLRVRFADGVEEANRFLAERNLSPLTI